MDLQAILKILKVNFVVVVVTLSAQRTEELSL